MKKLQGVFALALGSVLALSLFTGCGGKETVSSTRICFDNLPDDGIELSAEDTTYQVKGVVSRKEFGPDGEEVPEGTVATYENGTLIAKSAGTVELTLKNKTVSVEVVPAYTTDPGNQFTGAGDEVAQSGSTLGGTHDPSLIEVEENGKPAYYIFSTGWRTGNEIRRSTDLIHWQYMGKATTGETIMTAIDEWITQPNSKGGISWWAPDIVPAANGGYWLYTCCTLDGAFQKPSPDGRAGGYSPACIVLFKSSSLEAGSFRYQGVLMQSFIPDGTEGAIDVNSIDPQIIYSPDGKMYMAYGSFGTGNWMLELDPETGLRKDDVYKNGVFLDWSQVRQYRLEATMQYTNYRQGEEVKHDYYGTMISQGAMEAPVIARHDNVTVSDETGKVLEEGKTFYYSMHSYNGLDVAYQMWGGRSENPMGRYTSTGGAGIFNDRQGAATNSGNKYMGSFTWSYKAEGVFEPDIVLPGHNDLFTTSKGLNIAAYITRTPSYTSDGLAFMSQIHQYYLNSFGDICINANRYGKEIDRAVTKEELFKYTDGGKFQMIALENGSHAGQSASTSVDVVLSEDGKISYAGKQIGTWLMYGRGYIKLSFTDLKSIPSVTTGLQETYYGVVRPAWLNDQNKSGFTVTCLSRGMTDRSLALFMNNYSTLDV